VGEKPQPVDDRTPAGTVSHQEPDVCQEANILLKIEMAAAAKNYL
jgi:hypothetical protein